MAAKSGKVYAVRKGRKTGVFNSWHECQIQVKGYQGAEFSSFKTIDEAMLYLKMQKREIVNIESNEKINSDNDIVAYVDGSYDDIKKEYSCGVVLFINGEKKLLSRKDNDSELISMRNVSGEIMGSMMAMKYAVDNKKKQNKRLIIYHDYEGISKWCTGEWKTNKIGTKMYREFFMKAVQSIAIEFVKVKAHTGNKYNEEADKLAKQALYTNESLEKYEMLNIDSKNIFDEKISEKELNISSSNNIVVNQRKKQKTQIEIKYRNTSSRTDDIVKKIKDLWKKQKDGRKVSDILSLKIYINIDKLVYEWDMETDAGLEHGEIQFAEKL